jgi:HAD superfamily hydrolase (TIGR01509 family)
MTSQDARPEAVIFDLDGTLADNMTWHARAFEAFVARHGLPPVTMDLRRRIDGKRNSEILPMLFGREMTRAEVREYEHEKEGAYRELSRGQLRLVAGAARLLDRLAAHGIPAAVATSAPAENVAFTLRELGLDARLPLVARSDQVAHGKPSPDVYLHAASLVGAAPGACLAFEDAPVGVTAARAAGMACIALTTTFPAEALAASDPPPTGIAADFDAFLAGPGRWLLAEPRPPV